MSWQDYVEQYLPQGGALVFNDGSLWASSNFSVSSSEFASVQQYFNSQDCEVQINGQTWPVVQLQDQVLELQNAAVARSGYFYVMARDLNECKALQQFLIDNSL